MNAGQVVIGCGDANRAAAVAHAVASRSTVIVARRWPLERAIAAGEDAQTAVLVLDGYPDGPELRTIAEVTSARPDLAVLVVGPMEPDLNVLVALACGVFGYVPAGCSPAVVADAVAALLSGDAVLPRAASVALVQHLRSSGRGIAVRVAHGRAVVLTNREWEVLVLLRQTRTTAEIARRLVVSPGTVRSHVAALVHKLGAADRTEVAGSSYDESS